MLPILRIIPLGGVLLAILLLVLALDAPERIHTQLAPPLTPTRGPLISLDDHPEWRQILMRAAIRRAGELNRLRDLPDTPVRAPATPAEKFASLPAESIDTDPGPDDTAAAAAQPPATIPIDIGETSSVELPVVMPRERPPIITPARIKSGHESRVRHVPRARRARPATQPPPFDLFKAMFADPRAVQQQGQRQRRQQPQQQQPAFGSPAMTNTTAAQR